MAEQRNKKSNVTLSGREEKSGLKKSELNRGRAARESESDFELDEEVSRQGYDMNLGGKRLGGPTGGDLNRGGGGPAIGETHPADEDTAEHYGSREETNAALEDKIALQNTLRLNDRF